MVDIEDKAFKTWNERCADIAKEGSAEDIPKLLAEGCRALVPADAIFGAVYSASMKPFSFYDDVKKKDRFGLIESYLAGAYLLDPYYRAGIDGAKQGLYRMTDVAPQGFEESEFYKQYYYQSGIGDEIGYLTFLGDGCFANLSLVMLEGSPNFTDTDIHRLNLCQPMVHQGLTKYWKARAPASQHSTELRSQLEVAIMHFGNSLLTNREAEVMRLYLKGHSTASIETRLGISFHTISTHRKSAYQKLDINSQGELFHLFIDSLSCFDPVEQRDPLRGYLAKSS